MAGLDLVTLVVESYEPAIDFFVEKLGFELVEDSPAVTSDGHPKRWVVVVRLGSDGGSSRTSRWRGSSVHYRGPSGWSCRFLPARR